MLVAGLALVVGDESFEDAADGGALRQEHREAGAEERLVGEQFEFAAEFTVVAARTTSSRRSRCALRSSALAHAVAWNRFSILLLLSPRQYDPVTC